MKHVLFLLVSIGVLGLHSCDCTFDYCYTVTNATNGPIGIYWTDLEGVHLHFVAAGETEAFMVTDHGVEGCDGPHYQTVATDFEQLEILNADSIVSKRTYLDSENWTYNNGTYRAIVIPEEF
jgi:hypothetical protein